MDNLKIYQICHNLIDYFATLTSPKKSYLGPIFRTGGSSSYSSISFSSKGIHRRPSYNWVRLMLINEPSSLLSEN